MVFLAHVYCASSQPTSPPAILLRESFRQNGKVKSRTLANVTSCAPERIEALDRAPHGDFNHAALS
jgi:hypothetical protein